MFHKFIGFSLFLLLVSCAQVGVISGGEEDANPPRVITMNPENKGTQFKEKQIVIEFDEFIKLNNPTQTITVIPPDFKVNADAKGKTVTLSWTEELQPETTYSIFLNKTIQDITEANDSIMQLVFSTGDFLDSLSYSVAVVDAKTSQPVKGALVGLFASIDSLKPSYFAESNGSGWAEFSFVKKGSYYLRSFLDDNKDLKISKTEKMGFKIEPIELATSFIDSLPIVLFQPIVKQKITSFDFISPGLFVVAANAPIANAEIIINGLDVTDERIVLARDSILFTIPEKMLKETNSFNVLLSQGTFSDSSKLRIIDASKSKELKLTLLNNGEASSGNNFEITANDKIGSIDSSKFIVTNLKDSSRYHGFDWLLNGNKLLLNFPVTYGDELKLELKEGALSGFQNTSHKDVTYLLKRIPDNQLGVINLDAHLFEGPILIQVYSAGKLIQQLAMDQDKKVQLKQIKPGDYTFKVIADDNGNEYWDTGDFYQGLQPEEVFQFSEPLKVRANWEVNIELVPKE